MILKASERGHARALSLHLANGDENEHVDIHEIRGLVSSDIHMAFQEIDAASMGTQCKKPFFHLQLSPPVDASLTLEQYEKAVGDVERKLGLVGHPRAIVFHEKHARREANAHVCPLVFRNLSLLCMFFLLGDVWHHINTLFSKRGCICRPSFFSLSSFTTNASSG